MDQSNLNNQKHLKVLSELEIPYVNSFLKHPENLELFINHTFPMYKSSKDFIEFLQGGTFNESEIVKGLERMSIIMDDFDVAETFEKKSLDYLVGYYNYFSLVNYKNESNEVFELTDKILYGIKSINFLSGNYSVCEVGVDFDMMNSIVDISREVLKTDIEIFSRDVGVSSVLINDDLKNICNRFPVTYTLLSEKVDRIINYMSDLK